MITVATFTSVINQVLPEPHAGLLAGILFGTKKAVSKELLDALTTTGTLYLVALNGMNISVLVGLSMTTLLRFVSRRIASLLTILIIIGFVWFVGVTPSVLRAAIMGGLTLLSVLFGRQTWKLLLYGITIAIMLSIKPSWIGDLSFQISALATLGIILFGNKQKVADGKQKLVMENRNEKSVVNYFQFQLSNFYNHFPFSKQLFSFLYSLFEDDLRVTLAAQVFIIPLIFFTFGRISLVSPLTNILIGWIIAPLTALGMVLAILGWIWLPLGYVLGWVSWVLLEYLILVIHWTAKIPFASLGI